MREKYIRVFIGALLLTLGVNAVANEKSVFVREKMGNGPAWFVNSNEITDAASGLNFKAEMLNTSEVRWTIGNLSPAANECGPAHLLAYRGVGVNDVNINTPSSPVNGFCTAYLDLDNTNVSIVEPGRINMWSTYVDNLGEDTLDIRQIEINELATMTITKLTGNNTSVDQLFYVDASRLVLTKEFPNTVGMRLDVLWGGIGSPVNYSKEFFNTSALGNNTVTGRLPNSVFCTVGGTSLINRTLLVYRIDVFPGQGQTPTLVSTYSGQCQNQ